MTFPGLEMTILKFHDFSMTVRTLLLSSDLNIMVSDALRRISIGYSLRRLDQISEVIDEQRTAWVEEWSQSLPRSVSPRYQMENVGSVHLLWVYIIAISQPRLTLYFTRSSWLMPRHCNVLRLCYRSRDRGMIWFALRRYRRYQVGSTYKWEERQK